MGDFLRLNLPADFIQSWDSWLQEGMITARNTLGERWEACYLSAPIWRFSLPAGLVGKTAVSGILMASVDQVGRQYPLTLAVPCAGGDTPLRHFANTALFEALEEIALTALDEDMRGDVLADRLAPLTLKTPCLAKTGSGVYLGDLLPEQFLAGRHIAHSAGEVAIWTTFLDGGHRMLTSPGVPDMTQTPGLFDMTAPLWRTAPDVRSA